MRLTFKAVEKLARSKGLRMERVGRSRQIDVWADADHGVTAECASVTEAYGIVATYKPGLSL